MSQDLFVSVVLLCVYLYSLGAIGAELLNFYRRLRVGISVRQSVFYLFLHAIVIAVLILDVPDLFIPEVSIFKMPMDDWLKVLTISSILAIFATLASKYYMNRVIDNRSRQPIVLPSPEKDLNTSSINELKRVLTTERFSIDGESILIAVKGGWGTGKSYILKSEYNDLIKDDNALVVYKQVIDATNTNDFLSGLLDEIGRKIEARTDVSITSQLSRYLEAVSTAEPRLGFVEKFINTAQDPNTTLDEIGNILTWNKLTLHIFVDDIDRCLSKKELANTLRIVRKIASFKKTKVILAYDPKYINRIISRAIKWEDDIEGEIFMEKFVDVEVIVPNASSRKLAGNLYDRIKQLNPDLAKELEREIGEVSLKFNGKYRDVVKIANDLKPIIVNWDEFKDELYFPDVFILMFNKYMYKGPTEDFLRERGFSKGDVTYSSYGSFISRVRFLVETLTDSEEYMALDKDAILKDMGIHFLENLSFTEQERGEKVGGVLTAEKRFYNKQNVEKYLGLIPANPKQNG